MRTVVLVLLYNKKYCESDTLLSFLDYAPNDLSIYIFNNGPSNIEQDSVFIALNDKFNNVVVDEDLRNKPLSIVYNDFVRKYNEFDRFLIFDDDTKIPPSLFYDIDNIDHYSTDVIVPRVVSSDDEAVYYPLCNSKIVRENTNFKYQDYIISIGSGLIFYKRLVDKFNKNNLSLFDDRFALYGVDVSFFRRINYINYIDSDPINIKCVSYIKHSLSRVNACFTEWRDKERLYDAILSNMFYEKSLYNKVINLTRLVLKKILKGKFNHLIIIFKILKIKMHPRCKKFIDDIK
ncbi:hypothetical protein [Pectobacterium brasiliense]|uniref:hypothetical protein n=1 Tax=Pectobacterium brasiliense TaxID=180957 RepID=UPI0025A224D8|nr:hypothetical protein [Pectobacterium brasiliense]WJM82149.1 hypothetical protein QTI90_05215 [Pectobacterium brasiliense]